MNILAPSILSADFWKLGEGIEAVARGGAGYLHFDVMDGRFVPSISFGMPVLRCIRPRTKLILDVHIMIEEPERYVEELADCGADIITFHVEATERAEETIRLIHGKGIRAGLTLKPGTPIEAVEPYLDQIDMALVMTVEPGFGGQTLLPECLDKVRALRRLTEERGLKLDIEADGGIHLGNVEEVLGAGANVIVAGSAVFQGDVLENTKAFMSRL